MKFQFTGLVVVILAVALTTSPATAQYAAGGYGPMQPVGGASPMFVDPAATYGGCDACDAYGNAINPAMMGGYGGYGAGYGGGYGGGYGDYGIGMGYDQCGLHYFDFSGDFLYWSRERVADREVPFTSLGIDGPRILTSESMELKDEPGFRLAARLDLGPSSLVEASYFGTFEFGSAAQVASEANQLFSTFSHFGLDPYAGVGYTDTDNALVHRISIGSELNNAEINFRQYWVGGGSRLSGTWLMGVRYTRLTEDFLFYTLTDLGSMDYTISTENDLVGFQVGGDANWCVARGLRLTGECKVGIYNNRMKQRSTIVATTVQPSLHEGVEGNHVAMISDARVGFVANVLPSWTFRAGYEVLFMTNLALAADNFNPQPPFLGGSRTPYLDDSADALYHGLYAGAEFIW